MGNLSVRLRSRSALRSSNDDNQTYYYVPNKSFFDDYFVLGGERFETTNSDYLFGENNDLNFFACVRPCPYPYVDQLVIPGKKQQSVTQNCSSTIHKSTTTSGVVATSGRGHYLLAALTRRLRHHQRRRRNQRRQEQQQRANFNSSANSNTTGNISSSTNNNSTNNASINASRKRDETLAAARAASNCPTGLQPSHTLKSLLNIRKETLRIIKLDHRVDRKTSTRSRARTRVHDGSQTSDTPQMKESHPGKHIDNVEDKSLATKPSLQIDNSLKIADDSAGPSNISIDNINGREDDTENKIDLDNKVDLEREVDLENKENDVEQKQSTYSGITNEPNADSVNPQEGDQNVYCEAASLSPHPSIQSNFVRDQETEYKQKLNLEKKFGPKYRIEFVFDSEVNCSIRIYFLCTREVNGSGVLHKLHKNSYESKVYFFPRGSNQKFSTDCDDFFEPSRFAENELSYRPYDDAGNFNLKAVFPIVIHCTALEGTYPRQSHTLIATIERNDFSPSPPIHDSPALNTPSTQNLQNADRLSSTSTSQSLRSSRSSRSSSSPSSSRRSSSSASATQAFAISYSIKPIKQLLHVDGVQYLLQEIYGFENKRLPPPFKDDDDNHQLIDDLVEKNCKFSNNQSLIDKCDDDDACSCCSRTCNNKQQTNNSNNNDNDRMSCATNSEGDVAGDNVSSNCTVSANDHLPKTSNNSGQLEGNVDLDGSPETQIRSTKIKYKNSHKSRSRSLTSSTKHCQNELNNDHLNSSFYDQSLFECVICMSEERNTVLLPCRHMSICDSCARSLRYQANNCPICRAPFRALIHIRAIQRTNSRAINYRSHSQVRSDNQGGYNSRGHSRNPNHTNGPIRPNSNSNNKSIKNQSKPSLVLASTTRSDEVSDGQPNQETENNESTAATSDISVNTNAHSADINLENSQLSQCTENDENSETSSNTHDSTLTTQQDVRTNTHTLE